MSSRHKDRTLRNGVWLSLHVSVFVLWCGGFLGNPGGDVKNDKVSHVGLEKKVEGNVEDKIEQIINEPKKEDRSYSPDATKKIDYKTSDFSSDSDEILMARMLFGEGRNCSDEERIAIGYTAVNRANDGKRWNGETIRDAILKDKQYSCFNKGDANRAKLMDPMKYEPEAFEKCLESAHEVIVNSRSEMNKGQTHYFNPATVNPKWASKMEKIDLEKDCKHVFYRED